MVLQARMNGKTARFTIKNFKHVPTVRFQILSVTSTAKLGICASSTAEKGIFNSPKLPVDHVRRTKLAIQAFGIMPNREKLGKSACLGYLVIFSPLAVGGAPQTVPSGDSTQPHEST